MNEKIEKPERKITKVTKLHFLIHPGFISDPDLIFPAEPESERRLLKLGNKLLNKYIRNARTLSPTEIIVAFLHRHKSELKTLSEQEKHYFKKLSELKEVLGRRLVILSRDTNPLDAGPNPNPELALRRIRRLLKARGYDFDKKVLTEAYGETLGVCVEEGAVNLNLIGNFAKKTVIRTSLVDAKNVRKEMIRQKRKLIGKPESQHIDYQE